MIQLDERLDIQGGRIKVIIKSSSVYSMT